MVGLDPEEPRAHAVLVDQTWYPPKQVLAALTGWDRTTFTTQEATRVLGRLGFLHRRVEAPTEEVAVRWEYQITDWEPKDGPRALMEALGDEGWELVALLPNHWQGRPSMIRYYWKRPKTTIQRRLRGAV